MNSIGKTLVDNLYTFKIDTYRSARLVEVVINGRTTDMILNIQDVIFNETTKLKSETFR